MKSHGQGEIPGENQGHAANVVLLGKITAALCLGDISRVFCPYVVPDVETLLQTIIVYVGCLYVNPQLMASFSLK